MNDSRTYKNLIFSLISLLASVVQSIWFTPFIMKKMGAEAYGYIAVIMTLINIVTVISVAITSMSSRYITIEMQKKDLDEANHYFNSIVCSLCIISALLILIFGITSFNIQSFMNISSQYLKEVQILYIMAGISLIITILYTPFLAGLYYQNKLYIMYIFITLNYLSKIIVPIAFLKFGSIQIWNMSFGGLCFDVLSFVFYITHYKKYMPGIRIDIFDCKKLYIVKVLKSGIWVSITKAGSLLLSNISTYLSNIAVGVILTGIYATILQLQSLIIVLITSIVACFVPKMYKKYAEGKLEELVEYTKYSIRLLSIPLGLISGGIIIYGKYFMTLWIGSSYMKYGLLIFLMFISVPFSFSAELLNQLNITINKVKIPALVTVFMGIINVILILIFTEVLNIGIYGVALSQLIINGIRGFLFFPIYSSRELNIQYKTFFPAIIFCPIITLVTSCISLLIIIFVPPNTWVNLMFCVLLTSIIVFILVYICMLDKGGKEKVLNYSKQYLKKIYK